MNITITFTRRSGNNGDTGKGDLGKEEDSRDESDGPHFEDISAGELGLNLYQNQRWVRTCMAENRIFLQRIDGLKCPLY